MGKILIPGSSGGGVGSDDVTASKEQVLQGYKTVTTDSDDEVVEGSIQVVDTSQNNYTKTRTTEYGLDKSRSIFYMHLPQRSGYYTRSDNKPHVEIDSSLLGDALSSDVVDTKTATSKNGVAMRGTLQYKGNGGAPNGVVCPEMFYYTLEGTYVARFDAGAYYNTGERGQWKPYVSVPVWMAKQATNYHPEKTLSDTVTCQERGTVKMIDTKLNNYTNNQARNIGIDSGRGKLWMELGHGNAYYYRDDNVPHVETDASKFGTAGADSVLQWQTASSQRGIKFEGTIPRWIATHGDVIMANNSHSGHGFAYDLPGVGRGIAIGIKNGAFIQGANYAFLPSPNFQPWNVRKDVNMNGMIGTMEDYGAGRVAFRNATFDNVLVSGVANIGLGKDLNNYSIPSTEIRDGIIRFDTRYTGLHWYAPMSTLNESVTLAHSVNLSPFKTIRLGLKFPYGGDWGAVNSMGDLVGVVWALSTNHYAEYNPYTKIKVNPNMVKKTGTSRIIPQVSKVLLDTRGLDIPTGAEYFVDVDVSDLQGHHRIVLGFAVINPSGDKVTSRTIVRATNDIFGISHIEFIN